MYEPAFNCHATVLSKQYMRPDTEEQDTCPLKGAQFLIFLKKLRLFLFMVH